MEDFINLPSQGGVIPRSPDTEIILCRGIRWGNSYEHVRLFNNESELLDHVKSKCPTLGSAPYNIKQNTPISGGSMKVRIPAMESKLMDLNYLAFNNKGFIDRWFYAFITDINWLSDNSCIISFELDVFQNCAYRASYNSCFIEREHVKKANDGYGANLVPENLESGEMICNHSHVRGFGKMSIGMLVTETLSGTQVEGGLVGGVYQGAKLTILDGDTTEEMVGLANGLISNYNDKGKINAIVDVFMVPELCRQQATVTNSLSGALSFEGYIPKNNKLYTFPYCYALVDNNCGSTGVFKYEYDIHKDNNVRFSFRGELSPRPCVMMRPEDYEFEGVSYLRCISYTGLPQCSWNSDVYRAWAAQNQNTIALQSFNNAIAPIKAGAMGAMAGALTGGLVGASVGGIGGIIGGAVSGFSNQANVMAQAKDIEIEPTQIHGKASNLNLNASLGISQFNMYAMSCSKQMAMKIDDFFTAYGYKVNSLKPPELWSRPYWNFLKTSGCTFTGGMPTDMLTSFRKIFDKGVTLWHTDDLGNYGLNNNQ